MDHLCTRNPQKMVYWTCQQSSHKKNLTGLTFKDNWIGNREIGSCVSHTRIDDIDLYCRLKGVLMLGLLERSMLNEFKAPKHQLATWDPWPLDHQDQHPQRSASVQGGPWIQCGAALKSPSGWPDNSNNCSTSRERATPGSFFSKHEPILGWKDPTSTWGCSSSYACTHITNPSCTPK